MSGKQPIWRRLPRSLWSANAMEIFERMGWYGFYWCVALGNLFGGLLSGIAYQHFGPHGVDRPDQMWILFAVLAAGTAVLLVAYNRWVVTSRPVAGENPG